MEYFIKILNMNGVNFNTVIIIGILLFLGVTEVKKRKKQMDTEHEDELKHYHEVESIKETKEKDLNNRISELEVHDFNDYKKIQQMESHLFEITESLKSLTDTVIMIQIENKRAKLLNAPSIVSDLSKPVSAELYNDLFKTYYEYEVLLKNAGMENGQADLSMEVVKNSWVKRTEEGLFTESIYLSPEKANKKIYDVNSRIDEYMSASPSAKAE